jgi:hypothetical protein
VVPLTFVSRRKFTLLFVLSSTQQKDREKIRPRVVVRSQLPLRWDDGLSRFVGSPLLGQEVPMLCQGSIRSDRLDAETTKNDHYHHLSQKSSNPPHNPPSRSGFKPPAFEHCTQYKCHSRGAKPHTPCDPGGHRYEAHTCSHA